MKSSIAWHIGPDAKPSRLQPGAVDLEKHLEDWIDGDIDIVADDVLVIGRQLSTAWNTVLDLLGIDADGNLVIVELKRNQTLRDTVAQAIEYAAWVASQGYEEIMAIAAARFEDEESFRAAFQERFKTELPETLNQLQRILIVAPVVDATTETVVRYLAETFRMPINAVSFDIFGPTGNQVLVRHFVRDQADVPAPPTAKKKLSRTMEQLLGLALDNSVRPIVDEFRTLSDLLPQTLPYYLCFNLRAKTPDKRVLSGVSVYPTAETLNGAVVLYVGYANLAAIFGLDPAKAFEMANSLKQVATPMNYNWDGWAKFEVQDVGQAAEICTRIRAAITSAAAPPVPQLDPAGGQSE